MKMIDLHCDTIGKMAKLNTNLALAKNELSVDIEKLKKGNSIAQFFAIFVNLKKLDEVNATKEAYDVFDYCYTLYLKEMEANKDDIAIAKCYDDIINNQKQGKLSSVLTIEEGEVIGGKIERINELYQKGVRLITFTWNYENCLGYPNSFDNEIMSKGLKPFGIESLEKMNELGIAADVSHLSDGGFYDVARYSKKTFFSITF